MSRYGVLPDCGGLDYKILAATAINLGLQELAREVQMKIEEEGRWIKINVGGTIFEKTW